MIHTLNIPYNYYLFEVRLSNNRIHSIVRHDGDQRSVPVEFVDLPQSVQRKLEKYIGSDDEGEEGFTI